MVTIKPTSHFSMHTETPIKLSQITINGLRVRVRLDEGRITELLRGLDGHATTTAGLLNCIGDLATISFAPHMAG